MGNYEIMSDETAESAPLFLEKGVVILSMTPSARAKVKVMNQKGELISELTFPEEKEELQRVLLPLDGEYHFHFSCDSYWSAKILSSEPNKIFPQNYCWKHSFYSSIFIADPSIRYSVSLEAENLAQEAKVTLIDQQTGKNLIEIGPLKGNKNRTDLPENLQGPMLLYVEREKDPAGYPNFILHDCAASMEGVITETISTSEDGTVTYNYSGEVSVNNESESNSFFKKVFNRIKSLL